LKTKLKAAALVLVGWDCRPPCRRWHASREILTLSVMDSYAANPDRFTKSVKGEMSDTLLVVRMSRIVGGVAGDG
jgi:hypothetical protein